MTLKTQPTDADVKAFLDSVEDEQKRTDSYRLLELMEKVTGVKAKMWGKAMIGFGSYHYVYDSGREGDWFVVGFSLRKANLTMYIMPGFDEYDKLMEKLGKHKTGKSCLYVKKLDDIDLEVLAELVEKSVEEMKVRYEVKM